MRTGKEKSNKTGFEVIENEVSAGMEPRRLPIMKTIKEKVELTGLSYTYLRNLCIRNEIVHIRTGKKYLNKYSILKRSGRMTRLEKLECKIEAMELLSAK